MKAWLLTPSERILSLMSVVRLIQAESRALGRLHQSQPYSEYCDQTFSGLKPVGVWPFTVTGNYRMLFLRKRFFLPPTQHKLHYRKKLSNIVFQRGFSVIIVLLTQFKHLQRQFMNLFGLVCSQMLMSQKEKKNKDIKLSSPHTFLPCSYIVFPVLYSFLFWSVVLSH